ncbi:TPA: hypothetical protein N0F65_004215 [Lagenidium giganteum]|uniref:SMP-30/Gluconolactonase/LRE-like region domain-containing protein n=1 Tax=Lagenidium giganteum TaxID=4803 RepID=A0AAV2ZG65_9STRA|nr:TPA: hypothetical protein N0F65_004215 [Lagenidium giganteum]
MVATTTTAGESTELQLFRSTFPNVQDALLPIGWLWTWFTRRFSFLGRQWNNGNEPQAVTLVEGIVYGEGPRFRFQNRSVYFVDMLGKKLFRYDTRTSKSEVVQTFDEYVSGLGWLADGRLLIVAMTSRRLLALDEATKIVEPYADISAVTKYRANDMVVSASGHAYVGNFGFDFSAMNEFTLTTVVRVDPDRAVHVEATNMFFPNGSVITPDGKTLIVAETFAGQLTAFDIQKDGSLTNRRVWANVGAPSDGICLDAEGCVWVSVPQVGMYTSTGGALIRVREGGEIVNLYGFGQNNIKNGVFACQLGTDDKGRHLLFFLEALSSEEHLVLRNGREAAKRNCCFRSIEVSVGPALMEGNPNYCGGYC